MADRSSLPLFDHGYQDYDFDFAVENGKGLSLYGTTVVRKRCIGDAVRAVNEEIAALCKEYGYKLIEGPNLV